MIEKFGMDYEEVTSLEDALPKLDVLYMTRIQRERFTDPEEYERLKDSYILTEEKMALAKCDTSVLHPLPRVNEISVKVDNDKRACYFRQALYGKYMRMALILKLLEEAKTPKELPLLSGAGFITEGHTCSNPRCISGTEQELSGIFKITDKAERISRCVYCEEKMRY